MQGITPLAVRHLQVRARYWRIQYVIQFSRQLATLLQAGVTLSEGLELMSQQHPVLQWRALLQQLSDRITQGEPLSDALCAWPAIFSPLFIALVRTGELTGKLDECCQHLATQQEEQWLLKKKVHKALRYPVFIIVVAIFVTAGMLGFVLPEFAAIYKSFNTPLPALTRGVIALSEFIAHSWGYAATLLVVVIVSERALHRRTDYQYLCQRALLQLPLAGELTRGQCLSQIYTVLTLTQQTGIPLLDGLACARSTLTTLLWQDALGSLQKHVSEGEPLWSAMERESIFSPWCIPLIRIGEITGALDMMLKRLAVLHTERTRELADNLATALEPAVMVVMGLIIGTLVVAMYLPIFHLGDAMSAG